jgi:hypothetical protein
MGQISQVCVSEMIIAIQKKFVFLMAIKKGITDNSINGKSKKVSSYYNI